MNAGERAIVKEERRLEKERKRRIELANRMLIPVGGKTLESRRTRDTGVMRVVKYTNLLLPYFVEEYALPLAQ